MEKKKEKEKASQLGESQVRSQITEPIIDQVRAERILFNFRDKRSRFIFTPIFQPDCSSNPWMWPLLWDVYVNVGCQQEWREDVLDGHNVTERGETE